MKKAISISAFLMPLVLANLSFATDQGLTCVLGKFAENGSLSHLAGGLNVFTLKDNMFSMYFLSPKNMDRINRKTPIDDELLTPYGNTSYATTDLDVLIKSSAQIEEGVKVNVTIWTAVELLDSL
jgi:hypothetical protein